jgi:hypothetical protein
MPALASSAHYNNAVEPQRHLMAPKVAHRLISARAPKGLDLSPVVGCEVEDDQLDLALAGPSVMATAVRSGCLVPRLMLWPRTTTAP